MATIEFVGCKLLFDLLSSLAHSLRKPNLERVLLTLKSGGFPWKNTSARFRNKNIKHIKLEDLKKIDFKKKIGFLFGSEASGLTNHEISYANYTLQIPTNLNFKSLNLSHSLIIIAQYVASIIKLKSLPFQKSNKVKSASKKDIQSMVNLCVNNLDEVSFFKPIEKRPIMLENLRNIFFKMDLSSKETRILSSVFASLGKKRWLTKLRVSL